ncbi:hypothetical protein FGG08_005842 [Glutinoglossum americanum]|uniref:Uncharacterized protein n=1 Tax=Glutinoglossum americanum TaxID=1670608 RepID=A0A9P8KVM8_9PEZI|nr:hypothetical protein FGG08_005842 [Glutinoglossum americanum]
MTIYRSKGNQIHIYGYAAFGLTVTQYALMSLVNLLGNLMCPQYPVMYLVESEVMQEARMRPGAVFEGVAGRLKEDRGDLNRDKRRPIIGAGHPPFALLLPAAMMSHGLKKLSRGISAGEADFPFGSLDLFLLHQYLPAL